jgi:hypothetical protein
MFKPHVYFSPKLKKICPKLRKIIKVLESNEQWMQLFFLAYLSNKEPRNNKGTPSPEHILEEMFY